MKTISIFSILFFAVSIAVNAQGFERDLTIPVSINGNVLENPWAGGMDAPEYSTIDLNGDNIKDLFVFDRVSNRISTFINNGTPGQIDYHFAPQYIAAFPDMLNWVQLVDFNCDGKEDIFAHSIYGGIQVYKNVTTTSLQFVLTDSLIYSVYAGISANLYSPSACHASFVDVDGDTDLDILTPSVGVGLELHKNMSFDLYGTCDSLNFVLDTTSWGGIYFMGGGNESRNYLATDMDGDGDQDLLTNNIAVGMTGMDFGHIKYFENNGNATLSNLILIEDTFPSANNPAHIRGFAAAFEFDADNDTRKDLIISPQMSSLHNVNNSWFLKDTSSTPLRSFETIMDNFICGDMIDVGTVANVRFSDIDNDGLFDIIIGNRNRFPENEMDSSSLYYYHNNGTASVPSFELISKNFANAVTTPAFGGLTPAFGDLDGDLDNDMFVGRNDGTLDFYLNNGGNFIIDSVNYNSIDVGTANTPYLFDINQDGLIDLVCGNRNGELQYFENTGTVISPTFTLVDALWGDVEVTGVNSVYGYSYPVIYLLNGSLELIVGSDEGTIYRYGNISGNLMGTFTLLDSMYGGIDEKMRLTIDVADINNDSEPDILAGNFNGGAVIYKHLPVSVNEPGNIKSNFSIFPNPAFSIITVQGTGINNIQIINLLGEICFEKTVDQKGSIEIDISELQSGIYFVKAESESGTQNLKFIKY